MEVGAAVWTRREEGTSPVLLPVYRFGLEPDVLWCRRTHRISDQYDPGLDVVKRELESPGGGDRRDSGDGHHRCQQDARGGVR